MARRLKDLVSETVTNYRYVTERIARTESARVQHVAQIKSIKDNGYRYVKWYAEPGACKYCREIADNDEEDLGIGVFNVDDCPDIPIHPNCRCSISATWVEGKKNLTNGAPESSLLHLPKMKMDLQFFARKDPQKEYGLTDNEMLSINRYVGSESYKLNATLRSGTKLTLVQQNEVKGIDGALNKLPIYSGNAPLNRSFLSANNREQLDKLSAKILEDGYYQDPAYASSSKGIYDPDEVFRLKILKIHSGCDVKSVRSDENEILFPRNTIFKVVNYYHDTTDPGKLIIEVGGSR